MALPAWLSSVRRETWLRWGIVVIGIAVVLVVRVLWGPGPSVTAYLEEKYGVEDVQWDRGSKVRPETLIVDGRDISEWCTVTGAWGDVDDAAIRCTRDLGFDRVDPE